LPSLVVATMDTRLRAAANADTVVAHPRRGLPLTVREVAPDGRTVLVATTGAVEVVGAVPVTALGVIVCRAGRAGDRFYLGAGNVLPLRGGLVDGAVHVGGTFRAKARQVEGRAFFAALDKVPFDAVVPEEQLCTAPPPPRHAGTNADPIIAQIPGSPDREDFPPATEELDIPKDTPLALRALPAVDSPRVFARAPDPWGYSLPVVARDGDSVLVAVGEGPYLVGWVEGRPTRRIDEHFGMVGGILGGHNGPGPVSLYSRELQTLPLVRLPKGAELRAYGVVHARFHADAYARVIRRDGGHAYVAAAVDRDVLVSGWTSEDTLRAAQ